MWCQRWLPIPTPAARKVSNNGNVAGDVDAAGRRSGREKVKKAYNVDEYDWLDNFGDHSSGSDVEEGRSRAVTPGKRARMIVTQTKEQKMGPKVLTILTSPRYFTIPLC